MTVEPKKKKSIKVKEELFDFNTKSEEIWDAHKHFVQQKGVKVEFYNVDVHWNQ